MRLVLVPEPAPWLARLATVLGEGPPADVCAPWSLPGGPERWSAMPARLRAAGFDAQCFDYRSVFESPREHLARLERRIREWPGSGPVHLVGHSMGGLVARAAIAEAAASSHLYTSESLK